MDLQSLTRKDIERLADTPKVFAGGEEYEESGAIFQFALTPTGITARVHGNYGEYTVTVSNDLRLRCNCPYEGTVCKHMVAVLLHYLEGGYAEIGPVETGVPSALEQTLEAMPADALRELVLRLARDQPEVRRALLETVKIAPALLQQQPHDPKQVKKLQKVIDKTVQELEGYDYDYDDDGAAFDFTYVFDAALSLRPDEQAEIYWHIVTRCNKYLEEYNLSTEPIEETLGLYAGAVARRGLTPADKRYYLDTLMDALHWTMCGYGDVSEAIKDALDAIATEREDYEYLIKKLKKSDEGEVQDWVIGYYKKLGDDTRYLQARQENLHTEANHMELADFWQEKGDQAQALATLEAWVSRRDEQPDGVRYLPYRPDPSTGRGEAIRRLIAHYTEAGDMANLCRILMAQARQESVTLELYQRIQPVASKVGTWPERKAELLSQARGEAKARILLYEQEWDKAIAFAKLPGTEQQLQALVADAVKERHPSEAIALYDGLVQANIQQFNRNGYHAGARYAGEVKRIYESVLQDKDAGEQYITAIRKAHSRRPALQDEFRGL